MDAVRIFVAVAVNVTPELVTLSEELSHRPARTTHPDDLHITLKFVGDVPVATIPELREIVDEAADDLGTLTIDLVGLRTFGHPQQAEVLWVGIEPSQQIVSMASRLDRKLSTVGIATETRTFQPHITVAYLSSTPKDGSESSTVAALLAKNETTRYGTTTTGPVSLFRSRFLDSSSKNAQPRYAVLER